MPIQPKIGPLAAPPANPTREATYQEQQQNVKAQDALKQQELGLGETQLQQQNAFTETYQGKEYALADQYAKQNLNLSLADIYAQINQQKHELPITLNQIESAAGAAGAGLSKGRIVGQQQARYAEQQAVGGLGRQAQGQKLSYAQQIATQKLAMQKLKAGDILGYQQLKAQDALKSKGISLEEQKQLMDLQNSYAKTLSVSDIQNALYNHAISPEDATKRLEGMGYSSADAALIVGGYTSKSGGAAGGKNLTSSEIQKAVTDGLMTQQQGFDYLKGLGFSPYEAGILLQEGGPAADQVKIGGTLLSYDRGAGTKDPQSLERTPAYDNASSDIRDYMATLGENQAPSMKDFVAFLKMEIESGNPNLKSGQVDAAIAKQAAVYSLAFYNIMNGASPSSTDYYGTDIGAGGDVTGMG